MINILKERLLDGMEIKKVKEKQSKYEITFMINSKEYKSELPKTCAPGCQNSVADHTLFLVMSAAEMDNGNMPAVKYWLDRITTKKG